VATPSVLYFVRHAKAGERRVWTGADIDRPLSKTGWKQSRALAKRLAKHDASALYSSPYVRCVQTLEPLGELLDEKVRMEPRLLEGEPFEPVLDLIAEVADGSVLCSHGDIIPDVIKALHRRGMEVQTPPDWRKASVWVLRRKGSRVTKGKVWPPPTLGR
jgi:phosphohistidine phosphatase SixA